MPVVASVVGSVGEPAHPDCQLGEQLGRSASPEADIAGRTLKGILHLAAQVGLSRALRASQYSSNLAGSADSPRRCKESHGQEIGLVAPGDMRISLAGCMRRTELRCGKNDSTPNAAKHLMLFSTTKKRTAYCTCLNWTRTQALRLCPVYRASRKQLALPLMS